jgi:hypothetical protein
MPNRRVDHWAQTHGVDVAQIAHVSTRDTDHHRILVEAVGGLRGEACDGADVDSSIATLPASDCEKLVLVMRLADHINPVLTRERYRLVAAYRAR